MGRTTSRTSVVDSSGNVVENFASLLVQYESANIENNPTGDSYYGFLDSDGNWYIQQISSTDVKFVKGASDYSTNWTNRAALSYDFFDQVF